MGNLQHPQEKAAMVSGMEHMLFGTNRCIFEIIPLLKYDIYDIGLTLSSLFSFSCTSILTGEKEMKRWTVSNCWQQQCNNASAWQISCSISPILAQSGTNLRVSLGMRCLQTALCWKAGKGRVFLGLQTCCLGCGFWGRTFEDRWGTQSHFSLRQVQTPFCPVNVMLWVNNPTCCTQVPYTAV